MKNIKIITLIGLAIVASGAVGLALGYDLQLVDMVVDLGLLLLFIASIFYA